MLLWYTLLKDRYFYKIDLAIQAQNSGTYIPLTLLRFTNKHSYKLSESPIICL